MTKKVKMSLFEAVTILEYHNKWRRDDHIPNKYKMGNPTQLGIAIDTVVEHYENNEKVDELMREYD